MTGGFDSSVALFNFEKDKNVVKRFDASSLCLLFFYLLFLSIYFKCFNYFLF